MPCDSGPAPSDWDRMYARLNDSTRVARELAKLLTLEQLQNVSKPTAEWLAEHFRLDSQRQRDEQKERDRINLASEARKKLTPAEREALGIR